jgi:hypothetical protein
MDEPDPEQEISRITQPGHVAIQHSSGCVGPTVASSTRRDETLGIGHTPS